MQSQRSSSGFACDHYHSVQSTSCQSQHIHWFIMVRFVNIFRADSRFAPSQWEMVLLCNDIFYWLCASLESALIFYTNLMKLFMNTVICFMIVSGAFSFNILVLTINQSVGKTQTENILKNPYTVNYHYNIVNFLPRYSQKTPCSLPVRGCLRWRAVYNNIMICGVSFGFKSDLCIAAFIAVLYVITH